MTEHACIKCQEKLTDLNFSASNKNDKYYLCKSCHKVQRKKYKESNKDAIKSYDKKYRKSLRKDVIDNYGGKCTCCEENRLEFLTVDHVLNDGAKERKYKFKSKNFYSHLRKLNYPKDKYQLLCFNCNCAKGFFWKLPSCR